MVGCGRQAQEEGDICVLTADSLYSTAETNTIFQSNYTPIKKKKKTGKWNKKMEGETVLT